MNRFESFQFYLSFYQLQAHRQMLDLMRQEGLEVTSLHIHKLQHEAEILMRECFAIALSPSNAKAANVLSYLRNPELDRSASALAVLLMTLEQQIREDLGHRQFLWINPLYNDYVDNEDIFGSEVKNAFPSATAEIKEAGNCLAAECPTAAVFHLMRVAEHGLRALAFDRGVTMPRGPVELATWEQVIKELEDAENAIIGFPRTLAREEQLKFYHGANAEFRRFKNEFRNGIMHCRDQYSMPQALNIFHHVKGFMYILASKIAEGVRTPTIWT